MGERRPYKANVGGSNPSPPTIHFADLCCFLKLTNFRRKKLMSISLVTLQKIGFIDKVIIHSHDQSLYLLSVILDGVEHFVIDEKGALIKAFNKLELQAKLIGVKVGKTVLRQQTPYDEMIGLSGEKSDNTLEVSLRGSEYGLETEGFNIVH